jgi:hypothetical protein
VKKSTIVHQGIAREAKPRSLPGREDVNSIVFKRAEKRTQRWLSEEEKLRSMMAKNLKMGWVVSYWAPGVFFLNRRS